MIVLSSNPLTYYWYATYLLVDLSYIIPYQTYGFLSNSPISVTVNSVFYFQILVRIKCVSGEFSKQYIFEKISKNKRETNRIFFDKLKGPEN